MLESVILDQYTATRAYFASVVGLLFVESLIRLPSYLRHLLTSSKPIRRKAASHWALTAHIYGLLSYPIPIPYLTDYHVADAIRFAVFAALNIIFGINHNEFTTDYKLYGWLTIANGGLALLMAARTNLFSVVLRIPSPVLLLYHRWIGMATVAHATTHIAYNIMHYIETDQVESSFANKRIRIGITAWASLVVIFLTALPVVRRRRFEVFYYAHALFFVFMVGALIHTTNGPEFLLPGFSLWVADRVLRFAYNFRHVQVQSISYYKGDVTKFKIRGFKTRAPGQIAWVQIPHVSFLNWHPFTIASSPADAEGVATLAIRGLGGYTRRVQRIGDDDKLDGMQLQPADEASLANDSCAKIRLDGPYGVGRIQWDLQPVAVLVAGGIGITPGISIASYLVRRAVSFAGSRPCARENSVDIHLLWIVKDSAHIGWFAQELQELHSMASPENVPATFRITIHSTGTGTSGTDSEGNGEAGDAGLGQDFLSVNRGRPDIASWMRRVAATSAGADVAVNVCGPRPLITETRKAAAATSGNRGIFHVEEEVFEL